MVVDGLWGTEFSVPSISIEEIEKKSKSKKVKTAKSDEQLIKSKSTSLEDKLNICKRNVDRYLSQYKDTTSVLRTREEVKEYLDKCKKVGFISIDTETNNSVDPLTCKLMGVCIHTDGENSVYIPVNHTDRNHNRLDNQLSEKDIYELFNDLGECKVIMHNAKFDYKVLKCTTGLEIKIYWDTMTACRLLDENEKSASLKAQYQDKIDNEAEKYNITTIFDKVPYEYVDPDTFALYSATDAYKTTALYHYQQKQFENPDLAKLLKLFHEVEIPIITVSAEMELRGVCIDVEYANRLTAKYQKEKDEIQTKINQELSKIKPLVDEWRLSEDANKLIKSKTDPLYQYDPNYKPPKTYTKSQQLKDPIEVTSNIQLAILLYDILKLPQMIKNSRGVGADHLEYIYEETKNPLCHLILDMRKVDKLMNTYTAKLPKILSERDGRLHGSFNPLDTDTGRFASKDPNLQNIPSHKKEIRLMFKPQDNYKFVGADYSQAEPRLLAWYSQDEQMINAYKEKRDLYSVVASTVYGNKYEDNLEFYPDGSRNEAGAERRTSCKSIILGLMYGRESKSIAEQIGKSEQEAQQIIDEFYEGFPKVKEWEIETNENCRKLGYVEDLWGRRRRLPDMQLPQFSAKLETQTKAFNPLLRSTNELLENQKNKLKWYEQKAVEINNIKDRTKWSLWKQLKEKAKSENIEIISNSKLISQAERKAVNARVQGGSATITKRAMIMIHNDTIMKDLGFHLVLTIHDEVIGECPEENAEKVGERLVELMLKAPLPECKIPFKCDYEISNRWYEDEYKGSLKKEYHKLNGDFEQLVKNHSETDREVLYNIIKEN